MSQSKEVLVLVESLANTRNIGKEAIFEALEEALASAAQKHHAQLLGEELTVRVEIDRHTGEQRTYRTYIVIDPNDPASVEIPEDAYLTVEEAEKLTGETHQVGDHIDQPLESIEMTGRKGAATAKSVILQAIRIAEKKRQADLFRAKVGTLISGVVKWARDRVILDLGDGVEAVLPKEEQIPGETLRIGDRVRAYLVSVNFDIRGPQILVSRACVEMLTQLFTLEVPEISEEVIQIKAAARDPGSRSKIAVKTNDGRIDPIGACIGMRGSRVQAVSGELGGERVDIILWDDNPAQLVINAMAPAEIESIIVDEVHHVIDMAVQDEQLSQAIGRNGQNVRLASQLTGWELNVMSVEAFANKASTTSMKSIQYFVHHLDIDEAVAELLVQAGFTNLEELAYVSIDELLAIEGFDEEIAEELRTRASNALLSKALNTEKCIDDDLLMMDGVTPELAKKFAETGILTMEDLAELSIDDLMEIDGIDRETAGKLIMTAREPWFRS